jgi:nucleotide sugar dehydrogenase
MPVRKIGIIGHGYVGKAMHRLFASAFDVDVYDIETQPDWRFVEDADMHVVCVPTPEGSSGHADVSAVETTVRRSQAPLVLIKSTIPPGTTSRLQRASGDRVLAFSPEYIGEGKAYVAPWLFPDPIDARTHDFAIVGSVDPDPFLDILSQVMATHARLVATDSTTAELTKYMENAFLAMKVIFCNEFARIAESYGVSYHQLRDLWTLDSRVGKSHTRVFRDSPGYGGRCLPKDMAAICAAMKDKGLDVPLLEEVRRTNARLKK